MGPPPSTLKPPGNLLMIRVTDTKILSFNEPNKDLSAFFLLLLKRIEDFFSCAVLFWVTTADFSSFKLSKVKNSENGLFLKFLASFEGIVLSISKLVLVSAELPLVICLPTKLSLNVCPPFAA